MFEFDEDTAVAPAGEGLWSGRVTERWTLGTTPNGGYLMSLTARAVAAALPHPDPLSVTAYFVRRSMVGEAELAVESIKRGRRHSIAEARLRQGGEEVMRMLATFGDLRAAA